jgi:hypothetical protein
MNYYSQLLSRIFQHATGNESPTVIALLGESSEPGVVFPEELLPEGIHKVRIPEFEASPAKALEATNQSRAECVFAFPTILHHLNYSDDWRDRYGRLELPEILAETLMSGELPQPRRQRRRDGRQNELELDLLGAHAAASSHEVQCVVLLVPRFITASQRLSEWRQEFFPAHSATIIEHEHERILEGLGGIIPPALPVSTLIFRRNPGQIRFFKITDSALADGPARIASDLTRLMNQPAGKTRYGYVYNGELSLGYPCSYDFYSEETEQLRRQVSELGQRVHLGEVADVLMGISPGPDRDAQSGEEGVVAIKGRAITFDGRIDLSEETIIVGPERVRHYLQDGDFCIRQIIAANGRLMVGVFEGDGRAVTAAHNVIIIRPHPTLSPAQRKVLLAYLRSPIGYRLADAKQSFSSLRGFIRISPHVLRYFPVPLADEELSSSIEQLSAARSAFVSWIEQIDRESEAIIQEASATGSRARILNAGRLARQRHRAGDQVEEFDYRVRTQFPHPLAYMWRDLKVTGENRYLRLKAVTKAAEGHTCFLALIAILMSRAINQPIAQLEELGRRLSKRPGGTNFGDWFDILKVVNESKAFQNLKGNTPFVEITQLMAGGLWENPVSHLKNIRNDDCHNRIAPDSVSESTINEAEKALECIYRASEFLTDYQLLWITQTRFDSIRQMNRFQYRDLTGDNPLAQLREDQISRSDLETRSLYLRDRRNQLHLFRPLLQYLECPECHQMSTFFLDKYDANQGANNVLLKSFERNSIRTEPIAEDFRHVGIILDSK